MRESLPDGSRYVNLGLKLVRCEAFPNGRLIEHNYQSTTEVMPPVNRLYFLITSNGSINREITEAEFLGAIYESDGSKVIRREPYE
jgi:hypothetical protein